MSILAALVFPTVFASVSSDAEADVSSVYDETEMPKKQTGLPNLNEVLARPPGEFEHFFFKGSSYDIKTEDKKV
jgi:hypothetical protein